MHQVYDFSLGAGESYMAYCEFYQTYVHVDSVGSIDLHGSSHKIQYVHSDPDAPCSFSDYIIEGIGNVRNLLPRYETVDPPPGGYIACF